MQCSGFGLELAVLGEREGERERERERERETDREREKVKNTYYIIPSTTTKV